MLAETFMDTPTLIALAIGLILGVFILWGIAKCFSIMRRPTTNAVCVLSLVIFLVAWLVSLAVGLLKQMGTREIFTTLLGFLSLMLLVASFALAIVGLALYGRPKDYYLQGRRQATWVLVLSTPLLLLFAGVIYTVAKVRTEIIAEDSTPAGELKEFPDLNFRIRVPQKPWVNLKPTAINEEAAVVFRRRAPEVFFMLLAETTNGEDLGLPAFVEIAKGNLRSAADEAEFFNEGEEVIGDLPFWRMSAKASLPPDGEFYHEYHLLLKNGYFYQLMSLGSAKNAEAVYGAARDIVAGFEIIDPLKMATDGHEVADLRVDALGFATNLRELGWIQWEGLANEDPGAMFGALKGLSTFFAFLAVDLGDLDPEMDFVTSGLLAAEFNITHPSDGVRVKTVPEPGEGITSEHGIETVQEIEGTDYIFKIRTIRRGRFAYLAACWVANDQRDLPEDLSQSLTAIELFDVPEDAPAPTLTDAQKERQRDVVNEIGLAAFRRDRFEEAAAYFKAAYEMMPGDAAILENVATAYSRLGDAQAGHDYFEKHASKFPDDHTILREFASFKRQLDDADGAAALYKKLFHTGYTDEDVLLEFLNMLVDEERHGEMIEAIDGFVAKHPSNRSRRWQATAYARAGNYDRSFELFEALRKDAPEGIATLTTLAETYNEAERYEEAEQIANLILEKGHDTVSTYLVKGWSQANRKWYRRAKATFELAAKKDPANVEVLQAIQYASNWLGEGSNTELKEKIDPVPLPAALEAKLEAAEATLDLEALKASGHGAVYLQNVHAIHYARESRTRTTYYRRAKILDRTAISWFSSFQFGFDPLSETIYVNRARVLDASGNVLSDGKVEDYYTIDNSSASTPNQERLVNIPLHSLKPGCTLDIVVTKRDKGEASEFPFTERILRSRWPATSIASVVTGETDQIASATSGDVKTGAAKGFVYWIATNTPAYRGEPLQPPLDEFLPSLRIADKEGTWKKVGDDYLERIGHRLKIEPEIVQLAKKLTRGLENREAKIRVLSVHVRQELEYRAIEFGVRALVPNPASKVITSGFGDCKDYSLVLHQLLGAAGIPSKLALVNTSAMVDPELAQLDQFDHMIVYIPSAKAGEPGAFVDATDEYLPVLTGMPPSGLDLKNALILEKNGSRLQKLPPYPERPDQFDANRVVVLKEDGSVQVDERLTLEGYLANSMRDYLASLEPARREQAFQNRLANQATLQLQALEIDEANLHRPDEPLVIKARYVISRLFHKGEDALAGHLPALWERYYLQPTFVKNRAFPFEREHDAIYTSTAEFRYPGNVESKAVEAISSSGKSEFGEWKVDAKPLPATEPYRALQLKLEYRQRRGQFAAPKYREFHDTLVKILNAGEPRLTVKPTDIGDESPAARKTE